MHFKKGTNSTPFAFNILDVTIIFFGTNKNIFSNISFRQNHTFFIIHKLFGMIYLTSPKNFCPIFSYDFHPSVKITDFLSQNSSNNGFKVATFLLITGYKIT